MKMSTWSKCLASLAVTSVLFLWGFQITIMGCGIPVYFMFFALLPFLIRFTGRDILVYLVLTLILFAMSALQTYQGVEFETPARSFYGMLVYCFAFVVLDRSLRILMKTDCEYETLFSFFKYFLLVQVLLQILQIFLWMNGLFSCRYSHLMGVPRVYGFFLEPSHLAFSLSPFIYLFFFHRKAIIKRMGRLGLICVCTTFILCPSTTLVGIIGLVLFLYQWKSVSSIRAFAKRTAFNLIVIATMIWSVIYVPALRDRMTDLFTILHDPSTVTTELNISSLLFYKGYEMARAGLTHFALGVGFLNFQFLNEYSTVSFLSEWLYEMNKAEGTSFGFKVVGEYGYIGLVIIMYAIAVLVRNMKKTGAQYALENALIFGLIATCLRGASYFDGLPLLAFVVLYQRVPRSGKEFMTTLFKACNSSYVNRGLGPSL